jgi:hypothetical protein
MANDKLKQHLAKTLYPGVGADRIVERSQGCWNCIHWDADKAIDLWWKSARAATLANGAGIATTSPYGEQDERVKAIRRNVPLTDLAIERREWGSCSRGVKADGQPVGDFVASTFLCDRWTAQAGASVARESAVPDKLPEELMERFDGGEKID